MHAGRDTKADQQRWMGQRHGHNAIIMTSDTRAHVHERWEAACCEALDALHCRCWRICNKLEEHGMIWLVSQQSVWGRE